MIYFTRGNSIPKDDLATSMERIQPQFVVCESESESESENGCETSDDDVYVHVCWGRPLFTPCTHTHTQAMRTVLIKFQ